MWCVWVVAVASVVAAASPDHDDQRLPVYDTTKIVKKGYMIETGRWSECYPVTWDHTQKHLTDEHESDADSLVFTPRLGMQYRNVNCRAPDGGHEAFLYCGAYQRRMGKSRVCVVPEDCVLGEWLPWRPRADGSLVRTRRVKRLPQGLGKECDVVEEIKPAVLEPSAHWVPGPWGTCKVAVEHPPAIPWKLSLLPFIGNDKFTGNSREREPGTKTLAAMDETDDAAIDDAIYEDDYEEQYDLEDWSGASCGGGIQRREVTCVHADGRALHPAQCAHAMMPILVQPCEVPCPRDCEVGEWSEWGACQPTDGCPLYPVQQLTTTGYSVRRRRVISAASGGGAPCPPLEEKRTCSTPRCASWQALPWGPCVLNHPHTTCGPGKRTRELRCIGYDGKEAQRAWCTAVGAPARTERCRIACANDCVVSSWGPWSPCSAPCVNAKHDHPVPTRSRRRHILAYASATGWPCPSPEQLIQNETCNTHACATFSWLATPWGPCLRRAQDFIPLSNYTDLSDAEAFNDNNDEEPCIEEGEMPRSVMCVQNNADVVRESLCAPLTRPSSRRACTIRCRRGCRVEAWQPWSPCPNSCEAGKQVRVRIVKGGPNCGRVAEERACVAACGAAPPAWHAGPWANCTLPPDHRCGTGYTIRSVWCGSGTLRVEASECAGQRIPHTSAVCTVPCEPNPNIDCATVCKDPLKYLDDTDHFIDQPCVCSNVTLEMLPFDSDCLLPPGMECGEGRALRAARCLYEGVDVIMDVCKKYHPLSGPNSVREASTDGYRYDEEFPGLLRGPCSVRCARDCAAGPWGEWGPCAAEPGSRSAFRFRTREVIEEGSAGGRECGATLQRMTCLMSEPRWVVGEWSVCSVPREIVCGSATITRNVTCMDGWGKVLADSACEVAGAGAAPERQAECRAPCPADCVVSEWSDWSPCEPSKWGGRRDRTRVVLRPAVLGGAACPHLVAAEPCAPHTYSWHVSPYDDCQPLGGSPCGEGIKRRAVRCHRSDGLFVDDSFCQNTTVMESREAWCYVPCGVDCAVGEWGPWDTSACQCGDVSSTKHMRRSRQHLTAAVWPGRACPPTEQRAPCPREPCLKMTAVSLYGCHIHSTYGEETEGACGWGERTTVAQCVMTDQTDHSATRKLQALEPWRCANVLPGRIVSPPVRLLDTQCEIDCGCKAEEIRNQHSAWGAWGPCQKGARSRTRQDHFPPTPACNHSSRLVMVEWKNCTEDGEVPELEAVEPREEHPRRGWLERDQQDRQGRDRTHQPGDKYPDGFFEGSISLLALVWTATIVLCIYGALMIYQGCIRCIRSRRMKTITKV